MKSIPVKEAVGKKLLHDLTQIVPGEYKGARFKKGYIIKEEDIPLLLSMGKAHIYIEEEREGFYHENEAAEILVNLAKGKNVEVKGPSEGKMELISNIYGLLKVDVSALNEVNATKDVMMATKLNNTVVKENDKLLGTRIIPLWMEKEKIDELKEKIGSKKIIDVLPFEIKKVGVVTTGSEILQGIIKDKFAPVLEKKLAEYNMEIIEQVLVGDELKNIIKGIEGVIKKGAELVLCTGGMSVDADDFTPKAINEVADNVVSYGSPVLPGAMFMLAYKNDIPIMGLPGSVIYAKKTVFDLILPRVAAKDMISSADIWQMGHGGLL